MFNTLSVFVALFLDILYLTLSQFLLLCSWILEGTAICRHIFLSLSKHLWKKLYYYLGETVILGDDFSIQFLNIPCLVYKSNLHLAYTFCLSSLIVIFICGIQSTIEYTGDGSICIFGHLASKNHTGNWKASSLSLGKYRKKIAMVQSAFVFVNQSRGVKWSICVELLCQPFLEFCIQIDI